MRAFAVPTTCRTTPPDCAVSCGGESVGTACSSEFHRVRLSADRRRSSSSFSSPRVPKVPRTRFNKGYGTLPSQLDMLGGSMDGASGGLLRPRGRSEHMDEEEAEGGGGETARRNNAAYKQGDDLSLPFSGGGSSSGNSRQHLLHEIGHHHLLENGGWADRNSPGTNEVRRLRKLGTNFEQYTRSRRKVVIVTFAMAAAFSLISGLTSRMASFKSVHARGQNMTSSRSDADNDDQLILVTNTSGLGDTTTAPGPNTSLVAWYLALSSVAAVAACTGSFFLLWWISLRKRVTLSLLLMTSPLILIIVLETSMGSSSPSSTLTYTNGYLAETVHALAGAAFGLFLPSFFSLVTPHGPNTKLWATLGTPLGQLMVEALFASTMLGVTYELSHQAVSGAAAAAIALLVAALCVHLCLVPNVHVDHNGDSLRSVCSALRFANIWLRKWLLRDALAMLVASATASMFGVGATVVVIMLDIRGTVQLFGDSADLVLPRGLAVAIYAFFGLVGGLMGRKIAYMIWRKQGDSMDSMDSGKLGLSPRGLLVPSRPASLKRLPVSYVILALVGASIIAVGYLFDFAVVQPVGIFLVRAGAAGWRGAGARWCG